MNTADYVEKVNQMLNETFLDENGEVKRYYAGPIAGMCVDHHHNQIKDFLEESAKKEIISENDVKNLLKNQKAIPDGDKIPRLRPVVSGSGSNTKMISWLVDQEAKDMVPKLEKLAIYCVFCRIYTKNWQFTVYFVVIYAFFRCKFYSPKILPV